MKFSVSPQRSAVPQFVTWTCRSSGYLGSRNQPRINQNRFQRMTIGEGREGRSAPSRDSRDHQSATQRSSLPGIRMEGSRRFQNCRWGQADQRWRDRMVPKTPGDLHSDRLCSKLLAEHPVVTLEAQRPSGSKDLANSWLPAAVPSLQLRPTLALPCAVCLANSGCYSWAPGWCKGSQRPVAPLMAGGGPASRRSPRRSPRRPNVATRPNPLRQRLARHYGFSLGWRRRP